MPNSFLRQSYPIDLMLADVNQQLSLPGLLNILQDMATTHAAQLGHGYENSDAKNEFWVFSQQSLRITHMPRWKNVLSVETWVGDISSISAIREFALFVDEEKIGECSMQCMLLDKATHRPKRLTTIAETLQPRQTGRLAFRTGKIAIDTELSTQHEHVVAMSDLDLNQHVNNTKYAQWILDTLPLSLHTENQLVEYHVNFLAETFLGDCVTLCSDFKQQITQTEENDTLQITFVGERQADGKRVFSATCHYK